MAIGAIIGIISSVFQAVRAFSPPEAAQPQQAADKLFSKLDELGQGAIGGADLQTAFDRIKADAMGSADKLFSKLDADGDGKITRSEFSGSINQLADQLDQHYMRLRMHGEGGMPPPSGDAGFTRDELASQLSNIVGNFDKADADGDGRVSFREAKALAHSAGSASSITTAAADSRNVELMLQVVRLMQAYGIVHTPSSTAGNNNDGNNSAASRISVLG
ncbi:MAG: EF-hand domain-containing protein [Rhodocyclales bacterium]|nr:EF-hand domain-containing protein [Rhodocyclales bacterium]